MADKSVSLPITHEAEYQLIVVGGGLAGIAAAVAAARLGVRVALVQDRPVLGGNSSAEVRVSPVGASTSGYFRNARETGLVEEAFLESRYRTSGLRQINGAPYPIWDFALRDLVESAPSLDLYLNTLALEPLMRQSASGELSIAGIVAAQLGTEKTFLLSAELFVDASGDGRIAAKAGAAYRHGEEARSEFGESRAPEEPRDVTLGSSLLFSARDVGRPAPFKPPAWARSYPTEEDLPFRGHKDPSSGYWWIAWGGHLDTIADNEPIRDELTRCLFGVWDHLKNQGDHGAENLTLEWVGQIPGKRESRRFEGEHILTQQEIMERRIPEDQAAYGGWPIDLHPPTGIHSKAPPCDNPPLPGLYGIPYRSLYSRNVANLFVAGRLISATHVAHGSTRVMKTGAVIGQAVGTAAYLCLRDGLPPRGLYQRPGGVAELQQSLLKQGCYLLHVENQDPADLARQAEAVRASSQASLDAGRVDDATSDEDELESGYVRRSEPTPLDVRVGQLVVLSAERLDSVKCLLRSTRQTDARVTLRLRAAKDLRDFYQEEDLAVARASVPPGGSHWVDFRLDAAVSPGQPVLLLVEAAEGLSWERMRAEPPGTQAGTWSSERGYWRMLHGTHEVQLKPPSAPYSAENVVNGVSRPEVGANLWISDPTQPLPQWLELEFGSPVRLDTVYLTFDSNLDGWLYEGVFPELVRDYRLLARSSSGGWTEVVAEAGNYQRLRRHRFAEVETSALRLEVLATNGAPAARVYEVRAYREG